LIQGKYLCFFWVIGKIKNGMGVGMWIKAEMVYTISLFEISTGSEEPTVGIFSRYHLI